MSCNCQENNPCSQTTPCQQVNCACPVTISSDCVNNITEDLTCSNILKGQTLTEVLVQLDAFICEKFGSVANFLTLINVGTGAKVYKGDTLLGKKQLRSLVDSALINIVEGVDEITISVDETALNAFIEANQKTYSVTNVGTGAEVFKDTTVLGDNTQFNLRKLLDSPQGDGVKIVSINQLTNEVEIQHKTLNSSTLALTEEIDGSLSIEIPQTSSIPAFIVNQDATTTYDEWLKAGGQANPLFVYKGEGTSAKPFRDSITFTSPSTPVVTPNTSIQNALDKYVGTGTPLLPQFYGGRVEIQKSNTIYTFTGNVNYHGVVFALMPGANVKSAPIASTGENSWFVNLDHSNFTTTDVISPRIELNQDSVLEIRNNGFKNKGTQLVTNNFVTSKILYIKNNGGNITQSRRLEDLDVAGDYILFDLNASSTSGYKNDGHALLDCKGGIIHSYINPILSTSTHICDFVGTTFLFGRLGEDIDPSIAPFTHLVGGYTRLEKCSFYVFGNQTTDSLFSLSGDNPTVLVIEPLINGTTSNLASINAHISTPSLDPEFIMYNGVNKDGYTALNLLFKVNLTGGRTAPWYNVYFNNNYISRGSIDTETVDMTRNNNVGTINFIGRTSDTNKNVIEFLPRFISKSSAISGTMERGTRFIKYTTVTSGSFVVGEEYKIKTLGTTDFVAEQGASSNVVGTWFVATVAGTGTGTADKETVEVIT